jgi:hypothetical protein
VAQKTGHCWALVERIIASQARLWYMKFNKWLYTRTCSLDHQCKGDACASALNTGRE